MRRTTVALFVVALSLLVISGCAKKRIHQPSPQGQPKQTIKLPDSGSSKSGSGYVKPKTYTINGKSYTTMSTAYGFREEGLASWYGKDFHGRPTANGEKYNMYGMTAAHKLLPFNTKVRVTNLENGRETTVRINDRGPFIKDRIIDLTYTAAQELGIIGPGTARVRIQTIGGVPTTAKGNLVGDFFVQIGAFGNKENAENLCRKMRTGNTQCRLTYYSQRALWRVQLGPYSDLGDAKEKQAVLDAEYPGSFVFAD